MSPVAGIIAGIVGVLLALVMAAVVVARRRCAGAKRRNPGLVGSQGKKRYICVYTISSCLSPPCFSIFVSHTEICILLKYLAYTLRYFSTPLL